MSERADACDTDLTLWAERQARALREAGRAGTNLPIDWENVAEAIEALGKSQARELASRVRTILVHLIKLQASPAAEPRGAWRATIVEQRSEVDRLIEDSPSLRQVIADIIAKETDPAPRQVAAALTDYRETARIALNSLHYSETDVLGDWFPIEA
jgi:hypothetical protein